MDSRQLLMKSLLLVYRETIAGMDLSTDFILNVISKVEVTSAVPLPINEGRGQLAGLKQIIKDIITQKQTSIEINRPILINSIRACLGDDELICESFEGLICEELDEKALKTTIVELRQAINNHFKESSLVELVSKAFSDLKYRRDTIIDMDKYILEFRVKMDEIQLNRAVRDPSITYEVDFSDRSGLAEAFDTIKELDEGHGILKTGIQAYDNFLQGGFRPGDMVAGGALQHNYKTGFSLAVTAGVALYNVPHLRDPEKKPLIISISLEDDQSTNIRDLYRHVYENEYLEPAILEDKSIEEMSEYIGNRLGRNGFHFKLLYVADGNSWTHMNLTNLILYYEAQGYEVKFIRIDYLNLISKAGCSQPSGTGSDIRDLFRRIRSFCRPRGIVVYTPHQLSTQAKELKRAGVPSLVREIANKGYWDGCKTIDNEVDIETYQDIVHHNGKPYLEVGRGKHRGAPRTLTEQEKFFFLPFHTVGAIRYDEGKPMSAVRKLGGGTIGGGNEDPWFS